MFKHINCNCKVPEKEITCTTPDTDYETVENTPQVKFIDYDNPEDVEYLKKYNKEMQEVCQNFEPYPLTKEEHERVMHEKAIETCGGIEMLNLGKVLVGEMTPLEAAEDIAEYYNKKEKER